MRALAGAFTERVDRMFVSNLVYRRGAADRRWVLFLWAPRGRGLHHRLAAPLAEAQLQVAAAAGTARVETAEFLGLPAGLLRALGGGRP